MVRHSILIVGIDAPGRRPGEEKPRLFEMIPNHNLSASRGRGRIFLISIARNPLKSPDSGK
jgi:hypothetical protein